MKALVLAGLSAVALLAAACGEEKAPTLVVEAPTGEQPVQTASAPQGPAPVAGQVNWEAARADLAKRPADVVVPQAAGSDPLVVPMLLPGGIVQTASDRPVPPRITKDGYFATYHQPRYDVIVNGSQKALCDRRHACRRQDRDEIPAGRSWRLAVVLALRRGLPDRIRVPRSRQPGWLHQRGASEGIR